MKGLDVIARKKAKEKLKIQLRQAKRFESVSEKRQQRQKAEKDESGQIDLSTTYPESVSAADIPQLCQAATSTDDFSSLRVAYAIRQLTWVQQEAPIADLAASGLLSFLSQALEISDQPQLQYEAAWALGNIAADTHAHWKLLIPFGIIRSAIRLLMSPWNRIQYQGFWLVANVAADRVKYRDQFLMMGCLPRLINIMRKVADPVQLEVGVWAIANLCKGKPHPEDELVAEGVPFICEYISRCQESHFLTHLLEWLISSIRGNSAQVLATGIAARLYALLNHENDQVQYLSLRALGKIIFLQNSQECLQLDLVTVLIQLLSHTRPDMRKEALWVLSNISSEGQTQSQLVLAAGTFPRVTLLLTEDVVAVKEECIWLLGNLILHASQEWVAKMVTSGVVESLTQALAQAEAPSYINILLTTIKALLQRDTEDLSLKHKFEETVGISSLEKLWLHSNEKIQKLANFIICNYFEENWNDVETET